MFAFCYFIESRESVLDLLQSNCVFTPFTAEDKVEEAGALAVEPPSDLSDSHAANAKDEPQPLLKSPHACCNMEALVDKLSELIVGQRESTSGQAEVIKILRAMKDQGGQQLMNLQNLARHQSLLLENHQALLQQVSRVATQLQDMNKRPAAERQARPAA